MYKLREPVNQEKKKKWLEMSNRGDGGIESFCTFKKKGLKSTHFEPLPFFLYFELLPNEEFLSISICT